MTLLTVLKNRDSGGVIPPTSPTLAIGHSGIYPTGKTSPSRQISLSLRWRLRGWRLRWV